MNFIRFITSRLLIFVMTVLIGMTAVFIIPRLAPSDPVEAALGAITSSSALPPEAIESMRESLNAAYGLEGSIWQQYLQFIKRAVFNFDFGFSFAAYPTKVSTIIRRALPWTATLLTVSTLIAFTLGNLMGLIAGYKSDSPISPILEFIGILFYPIPYYIFSLSLIMIFSYVWPIFPLSFTVLGNPASWRFISGAIYSSILPAISLVLVGFGWWIVSMKSLILNVKQEDYVIFARLKGLSENRVMMNYVLPNVVLPQVTVLALQMGTIFNGALITEILFNYPGIGSVIYSAVTQSDYNLIIGSVSITIIAVASATFLVDLLYPLFDPRVRYS